MLVLSAPPAIRHCQAKVGSAVINRNSCLKGRQPLNPDARADAANVERALHSRRNSTPRPAGGQRASSHGDVLAPSCPSPSVAFRGISGGGWANKERHRREEGGQAVLRRRQRCPRAALSATTWPAAEPAAAPSCRNPDEQQPPSCTSSDLQQPRVAATPELQQPSVAAAPSCSNPRVAAAAAAGLSTRRGCDCSVA